MEKLKEKLWEELEEISRKPEMGAGDLELAHKLTDTIKNIDKICMLEDDGGYSRDGGMDNRYSSRRDRRGRYSSDGARSKMMEYLKMALDSANEQDREDIKRFMRRLENS